MRSQVLTSTGLLILDWYDERLTWDKEISNLDEMVISSKHIWKPEFAVINGSVHLIMILFVIVGCHCLELLHVIVDKSCLL